MTTFVGFNTQNQYKKFTLLDYELIKRDLLNAFNIRQGQLPGRPGYGTILWDYLFENQIESIQQGIINEVQRVIAQDPRIAVSEVQVYPQQNGVLIEIELQTVGGQNAELLNIFFNPQQTTASYV
jgi:phage baseplate assembly protein W